MVRLDRIYTRSGDEGETSLRDGTRIPKHASRIIAQGDVDEANAAIGFARAFAEGAPDEVLARVQNDLFDLGADLTVPDVEGKGLRITEAQVGHLEAEIDRINADLETLESFVLSGGSVPAASLHLARCVVRRAERAVSALAGTEAVSPLVLAYLNRLSDLLFVMARAANDGGRADVFWLPGEGGGER